MRPVSPSSMDEIILLRKIPVSQFAALKTVQVKYIRIISPKSIAQPQPKSFFPPKTTFRIRTIIHIE